MPLPYRVTLTTTTVSSAWNPSYFAKPFNIGVNVTTTTTNSSGVSYTVQHTFDPIFEGVFSSTVALVAQSAATWFPNSGLTTKSCSQDGNYAYPVVGIRLSISSGTAGVLGAGVTMTLIQAGN